MGFYNLAPQHPWMQYVLCEYAARVHSMQLGRLKVAHLLCRPSTPHLLLQNSDACLMTLHFLHCFWVTVGCGCCKIWKHNPQAGR